ncbi:single-stranded DNA-binding protein [Candidatus Shapirobacteria bacterium]|nr:single-stranded DNA-binding protein [Candidatus Shapirobacteria bacterium]
MANRCLNKVMLIGNLTRDPELRYTPGGVAVVSFGLATNRRWTTQTGEQREDAQFHRIVAWSKLAELCSQLLVKGRKVYVEGRLQHKEWTGNDGVKRKDAEIIINDMIILDSRQASQGDNLESELEKAVAFGDEQEAKDEKNQKPEEVKDQEEQPPF